MLNNGASRSKKLYQNVVGSGVYKGINVLFSLLIVRFSIQVIGEEQYGVWLTLLSFFTWFSALEVGVSNSLRNSITLFFAKDQFSKIKELVHKGYKALLILYFGLITLLILLSVITDLSQLILPEMGDYQSFNLTFQVCIVLYFTHFIFFFLHNLLLATHFTKATYLINVLQNGVLLIGLMFCHYFDYTPSLLLFCLWFSVLPLIVWSFSSIYYYNSFFQKFKPQLREIIGRKTKAFQGLNKDFFLIQICTLILFSTDHIIIINYIGSYEVTAYNVTFRYFNILIIIFNVILVPYWASFTDAFGKEDDQWIVSHFKKLIFFWLGIGLVGIVMLLVAEFALKLWIGKELTVSFPLLLFMFFSVLLTAWNSIFAYFLNSVSKTKLQMRLLFLAAVINIPLSIYLIEDFGVAGIILATCISLLPQAIFLPAECRKVIQNMRLKNGV